MTRLLGQALPAALVLASQALAAPPGEGWITGYDTAVPQTGNPTPAVNQPFVDDVYGRTIRRISEANAFSGSWVRHEYSRRQAFNADDSRLIMLGSNGTWLLYTLAADETVSFERTLPSMSEPNWVPDDPQRFRYFPRNGGMQILEYDIASDAAIVVADFNGRLPWPDASRVWTAEEGEPSADGRIWCLLAENADFQTVGMFSYDLATDSIIATASLSGDPDHISTSPSGSYCVPSGNAIGGTWAYGVDFADSRQLHPGSEHSDLAIDTGGREVLVYADYGSGWVTMVGLDDGLTTQLVDIYEISGSAYALHLSGNNYAAPGYVVISTYAASLDYGATPASYGDIWGHDRLAIVELDDTPTIYNVAYMHNVFSTYWTEPHATVNRDLTRILFASNWETGAESEIASYLVSLDGGSGGGQNITLSATVKKERGAKSIELSWAGAEGAEVLVRRARNGREAEEWVTSNDGSYIDTLQKGGSYAYRVCESDGLRCSAEVTASF